MRRVHWLVLTAVLVRLVVAVRTAIPGRDGATYLWMAESVARGDVGALFRTVFHPLYPALVAVGIRLAPSVDPVVVGQIVASGLGALAVVPLFGAARALFAAAPNGELAATIGAIAYATGTWFARHPAECMSEGPFYLAVATWAWLLLAAKSTPIVRAAAIGAIGGLAFLLRPEGGALVLVGALASTARGERLAAATTAVVGAAIMALLPLGFLWFGDGATLTPKAVFNYEVGVGSASSPVWHYLSEAAVLPLSLGEELGWLWLPLAALGVVRWRARSRREPAAWLLWPFWLQCAVVPLLHSHWRFLSGYGILLLPFAGAAAVELFFWLRRRWPDAEFVLPILLAAAELRVVDARNSERVIERDLGRALAATLAPGEFVVSDMPRLDYFAGQKPPPPRPILPAEVLARAADPRCRHVALVAGRTAISDAELAVLGLEPAAPPPILTAAAHDRGIRLFQRPRPR